jgi:crotonobetainyl-CoA:carnitine CoA-transferase CaiB-like acyl-CoA transferase
MGLTEAWRNDMTTGALSDLRVIELGNMVSAPFCAKMLASLGAEVIKVEKPVTGDDARRRGPFLKDEPHLEGSGLFLYLNTDKLGVTLNLETSAGYSIFEDLIRNADILIESNLPQEMRRLGLDYETLKDINPRLIMTSITPFGQTGPYREYKGSDLTAFHAGGLGAITPRPTVGLPDEGPVRMKGHFADFLAGLDAAAGTMCLLFERDMSGKGQHLDISAQESVAVSVGTSLASNSYAGLTSGREGSAPYQPVATMACKDGYIDVQCMTEEQWQRFVELMGNPDWAHWEVFEDIFARAENWDALEPLITDWLRGKGKQEFYLEAQGRAIPSAPVNTVADLVDSEHIAARNFFTALEHPETGTLQYPGPFYKLSETPARVTRRAPFLGEHNEQIYCGRLGYSQKELDGMRKEGIV